MKRSSSSGATAMPSGLLYKDDLQPVVAAEILQRHVKKEVPVITSLDTHAGRP
jgi:hypothetical protein